MPTHSACCTLRDHGMRPSSLQDCRGKFVASGKFFPPPYSNDVINPDLNLYIYGNACNEGKKYATDATDLHVSWRKWQTRRPKGKNWTSLIFLGYIASVAFVLCRARSVASIDPLWPLCTFVAFVAFCPFRCVGYVARVTLDGNRALVAHYDDANGWRSAESQNVHSIESRDARSPGYGDGGSRRRGRGLLWVD